MVNMRTRAGAGMARQRGRGKSAMVPQNWPKDVFPQPWPSGGISKFKKGPGTVAQWLRSLPFTPRIPYGRRFYPGSSTSHPAPACGPGKQSRTALHPRGRPGRGSWLRIGIASAVALTWGVNHRMEDLPLCLSSLYIRLSNEKKKKRYTTKYYHSATEKKIFHPMVHSPSSRTGWN